MLAPLFHHLSLMRLTLGLTALLCAACADRAPSLPADLTRSDSSGVVLLESSAPERPLDWTFTEVSRYRDADSVPIAVANATPRTAMLDRGGRLYLLDTAAREVLRFQTNGVLDRRFGGSGDSVGQMRRPVAIGSQGDSIFVFDAEKRALVRWGADFTPLADRPLSAVFDGASAVAYRINGAFVERSVAGATGTVRGLWSDTTPGASPIAEDSHLVWNVQGRRIAVAAGASYEITIHDALKVIAKVRRRLPVGGEAVAAVQDVVLHSDGTLWVQRSAPGASVSVVDVITPNGAYAGTLSGRELPLALYKNGDLLLSAVDSATGSRYLVRTKVVRGDAPQ